MVFTSIGFKHYVIHLIIIIQLRLVSYVGATNSVNIFSDSNCSNNVAQVSVQEMGTSGLCQHITDISFAININELDDGCTAWKLIQRAVTVYADLYCSTEGTAVRDGVCTTLASGSMIQSFSLDNCPASAISTDVSPALPDTSTILSGASTASPPLVVPVDPSSSAPYSDDTPQTVSTSIPSTVNIIIPSTIIVNTPVTSLSIVTVPITSTMISTGSSTIKISTAISVVISTYVITPTTKQLVSVVTQQTGSSSTSQSSFRTSTSSSSSSSSNSTSNSSPTSQTNEKSRSKLIIGITVPICCIVLLGSLIFVWRWVWRRRGNQQAGDRRMGNALNVPMESLSRDRLNPHSQFSSATVVNDPQEYLQPPIHRSELLSPGTPELDIGRSRMGGSTVSDRPSLLSYS